MQLKVYIIVDNNRRRDFISQKITELENAHEQVEYISACSTFDLDKIKDNSYVVVDRIENSLNPYEQQRIIRKIYEQKPTCNFIITTLSPFIVQTVSHHLVYKIYEDEEYEIPVETYGKDLNSLATLFEVYERPEWMKSLFKKFYNAIDSENYKLAELTYKTIENLVGVDDPELISCRVKLTLEQEFNKNA